MLLLELELLIWIKGQNYKKSCHRGEKGVIIRLYLLFRRAHKKKDEIEIK